MARGATPEDGAGGGMGRAGGGIEGTLVLSSVGRSRPGLTARSTVPEAARSSANEGAPTTLALRAYPNPLAMRATLAFDVPEAGPVHLALYDLLGRAVSVLAAGTRAVGTHKVLFDAAGLPSGIYVDALNAAKLAYRDVRDAEARRLGAASYAAYRTALPTDADDVVSERYPVKLSLAEPDPR
ncbi:MAG: T9SS type A sorting domain-containing protein [Bacteroidota bacterium]